MDHHNNKITTGLLFIFAVFTHSSFAANFCVTNSVEFQAALNTAASNTEDDLIRLERGSYPIINGSSFYYSAGPTENYNLTITGGFVTLFNTPCAVIPANNSAFETKLDGLSQSRVLYIAVDGSSGVEISGLYFSSGDATALAGFSRGGGLYVVRFADAGETLIENNVFIGNQAHSGSALLASGGYKVIIRNNFVFANTSVSSSAISSVNNHQRGIYFTNNTVMYNNTGGSSNSTAAAYISTSGTSRAFIANNLMWGNEVADLNIFNAFLYNNNIGIYTGNPIEASGNFSAEPEFSQTDITPAYNGNLYNKGLMPPTSSPIPIPFENDWALGLNDALGYDRLRDGQVDIGAFEAPSDVIFADDFEGF